MLRAVTDPFPVMVGYSGSIFLLKPDCIVNADENLPVALLAIGAIFWTILKVSLVFLMSILEILYFMSILGSLGLVVSYEPSTTTLPSSVFIFNPDNQSFLSFTITFPATLSITKSGFPS